MTLKTIFSTLKDDFIFVIVAFVEIREDIVGSKSQQALNNNWILFLNFYY
jgi:hypothetical protein